MNELIRMPALKKIIIAVVALYIAFLFSGFLLPTETRVSREILIDAPNETVFKLVSEHREFRRWSPWAAKDPKMEVEYEGPEVGVGAKQLWRSAHPQVGNGESIYTVYEPYSKVEFELRFEQGGGTSAFNLSLLESGLIKTEWHFVSPHNNIFERFIGFFLIENLISPDLEQGLTALKTLAESQ